MPPSVLADGTGGYRQQVLARCCPPYEPATFAMPCIIEATRPSYPVSYVSDSMSGRQAKCSAEVTAKGKRTIGLDAAG